MPSSRRRSQRPGPSRPSGRTPRAAVTPSTTTDPTEPLEPVEPVKPDNTVEPVEYTADYDDTIAVAPRLDRYGAAAGVAYALMAFFASWLLAVGTVTPTSSSEDIARHLADIRGRLSAGVLLSLLSVFFLIVFACWLHRWLREIEGERGWVATVALVGAILMAGAITIVAVLTIGLTTLDDYGTDTVIGRTLLTLHWQSIAVSWVPTALLIGSVGAIGSRTGQLPRWLSTSGVAIAVGLLIPPIAFLPYLLSNLWLGLLAVFLLQRSRGRI